MKTRVSLKHFENDCRTNEKKNNKNFFTRCNKEKINYLCYTESKFNYPKFKRILLSD